MMKNKKMKKLGAALLSAALLLTPCDSLVNAKENPYDDWKTTALQSPQKGKLVAAGDIDVKWNLESFAEHKKKGSSYSLTKKSTYTFSRKQVGAHFVDL